MNKSNTLVNGDITIEDCKITEIKSTVVSLKNISQFNIFLWKLNFIIMYFIAHLNH